MKTKNKQILSAYAIKHIQVGEKFFYNTSDIEQHYSGHFFSTDSKRFFGSRILNNVYQGPGGIYFVTSEQDKYSNGPRLYTVRQYDPKKNTVFTVGDFQAYATSSTAKTEAMRLAVEGS